MSTVFVDDFSELQDYSTFCELLEKADTCIQMDRDKLALQFITMAQKMEPENALVYQRKAICYESLKNYKAAEKEILHALKLNAEDDTNHRVYADILRHLDNTSKAKQEYEKALELDPECGVSHINYALLLEQMGRANNAIKHTKKALELDPNDEYALHNLAAFYGDKEMSLWNKLKPWHFFRFKNLCPKARFYAGEVLKLNPNRPGSLAILANILLEEQKAPEAKEAIRKALYIDPESAYVKSVAERCGRRYFLAERGVCLGWLTTLADFFIFCCASSFYSFYVMVVLTCLVFLHDVVLCLVFLLALLIYYCMARRAMDWLFLPVARWFLKIYARRKFADDEILQYSRREAFALSVALCIAIYAVFSNGGAVSSYDKMSAMKTQLNENTQRSNEKELPGILTDIEKDELLELKKIFTNISEEELEKMFQKYKKDPLKTGAVPSVLLSGKR